MADISDFNYPAPQQKYKVLVWCATYNHSKYIEDALKGFAMQQTNFSFVCLVMDDASTDGEQEVIKKWMERECDISQAETIDIPTSVVILVPHKTNASCTFAFYFLKQNLWKHGDKKKKHVDPWRKKCEYEAICEGDDYWIDPLKLQKQVDFLEEHSEYGMCHTAYKDSYSFKRSKPVITTSDDRYLENILKGEYNIGTLTTMFRTDIYFNLPHHNTSQNFKLGDSPLWIEIAHCSKIKYIDECTSVYRILHESASHSNNVDKELAFHQSCVDCRIFYSTIYNISIPLSAQRTYMASMRTAFMHGNKDIARKILQLAKSESLVTRKIFILYIGTIFPIIGRTIKKIYYRI